MKGDTKIIPNPPTKMVFIALMILPHKQFGDMTRELIRKKIDMVSHAKHYVYTRTKKKRRARRDRRNNWKIFLCFIYCRNYASEK